MKPLVVSDNTITQLEQVAHEQGTTPQELAEQVIREFLRNEARKRMQQETDAFLSMHARLMEEYLGQYVAVLGGQIVDHDHDQLALFQRIDCEYPDTPVLIKQVVAQREEVYAFRSPRIEAAS
jgi:hypothetical protein